MSRTFHHGHQAYRDRWQHPRLPASKKARETKEALSRTRRNDAGVMRWMPRDSLVLHWIAEMRAIRFDQFQVLLGRHSPQDGGDDAPLSRSRTSEILSRYLHAGLVRFQPIFHGESGWISPTWRAMRRLHLPYSAAPPAMRTLEHLFWINEVRLQLEALSEGLIWRSERSLPVNQGMRVKGQRREHVPDGLVCLPQCEGLLEEIEIEVQISRPSRKEVEDILCEASWTLPRKRPLWYFVTASSAQVVQSVQRALRGPMRTVQILDLHEWLR